MNDLDERLTTALRQRAEQVVVDDDLDDILRDTVVIRFSDHDQPPRRSGAGIALGAAAATVLVAAAVWFGVRDGGAPSTADLPAPPSTVAPDSPDAERDHYDRLLFPVGAEVIDTTIQPAEGEPVALAVGPDGRSYLIGAMYIPQLAASPEADQRIIGAREFVVEPGAGWTQYLTIEACAQVHVTDVGVDATAWSAAALELLGGISIDGARTALDLPTGWQLVDEGVLGPTVRQTVRVEFEGEHVDLELTQLADSPLASVVGLGVEATTLGDDLAYATAPGGKRFFNELLWSHDDSAVQLRSRTATVDQLKAIAATLEDGHGAEWRELLTGDDLDEVAVGTAPPATADVPADLCGPVTLTVTGP